MRFFAGYLIAGLLLAVVFGGCSEDKGTTIVILPDTRDTSDTGGSDATDTTDSSETVAETNDTTDTVEVVEGPGTLSIVGSSDVMLEALEQVPVQVEYLDEDGDPVVDAEIEFVPTSATDAAGSGPVLAIVRTDGSGRATATLRAGGDPAIFTMDAFVVNDNRVDKVTFSVTVTEQNAAAYNFDAETDIPIQLTDLLYRVYTADAASCASIEQDFRNEGPVDMVPLSFPTNALDQLDIGVAAGNQVETFRRVVDFDIQGSRGLPLEYAVAVGFVGDTAVVYDCVDIATAVKGDEIDVLFELLPLFPNIAGTYDIDSAFNLLNAIPDSAETIVLLVADIFTDPVGFLIQLLLDQFGLDDANQGIIDAVSSALQTLVEDFLGDGFQQFTAVGNDILGAATMFALNGSMTVNSPIGVDGAIPTSNVSLNRIELDVPSLSSDPLIFQLDGAISGSFTGNLNFSTNTAQGVKYTIELDRFPIDLLYGEIIIFLIEDVLLFETTGQDTIEGFLGTLLDCEDLAEQIDDDPDGIFNNIVESSCEGLLDAGGEFIRGLLRDLTVASGDFFTLATPTDEECLITSVNTQSGIDYRFGSQAEPCAWDGRIRFDSGAQPEEFTGSFFVR